MDAASRDDRPGFHRMQVKGQISDDHRLQDERAPEACGGDKAQEGRGGGRNQAEIAWIMWTVG